MNNLSTYIIEKLRINKDTKLTDNLSVLEKIMVLSQLNKLTDDNIEEYEETIKNKWMDKYNINNINCIVNNDLKNILDKLYPENNDDFIEDDNLYYDLSEIKNSDLFSDENISISELIGIQPYTLKIYSKNKKIHGPLFFIKKTKKDNSDLKQLSFLLNMKK